MQFPLFLVIILLWLFIGLPLSKLNQQAKKRAAKTQDMQQALNQKKKQEQVSAPQERPAPVPEPSVLQNIIRPTVSVTEHDDSVYRGSINAETGEGYDPCHDEQLAPLTAAESAIPAAAEEIPGIRLGWTGSDIVRGIVMSEILNNRKGRVL